MKASIESTPAASADPEKRLGRFIGRFDAKNEALMRACRNALRRRFPTANELVWDNYNFLVIGYSPTERPSDSIVALAAGANGVGLSFYRGATLPDPHGIVLGEGAQNRFIRLASAKTLSRPETVALADRYPTDCRWVLDARPGLLRMNCTILPR